MTLDIVRPAGTVMLVNPLPADMLTLATSTVARHLAISRSEAEGQLRLGAITLDDSVDTATQDQLFALLAALGLTRQTAEWQGDLSLSVQLAKPVDLAYLAPKLAAIVQLPLAAVMQALPRPGGVTLENLTADGAHRLRKQIRRIQGFKTVQSNMTAQCDLFVISPLPVGLSRSLGRYLALLGAVSCRFSGAVAAGLSVQQVRHICGRFPQAGLIGLDRAFQRFDVFLTGIGDLAPQDVAEFLSTRTNMSGAMVESVTPLQPLQIEHGLSRGVTQHFRADYAAIGLQTCARLSGR